MKPKPTRANKRVHSAMPRDYSPPSALEPLEDKAAEPRSRLARKDFSWVAFERRGTFE